MRHEVLAREGRVHQHMVIDRLGAHGQEVGAGDVQGGVADPKQGVGTAGMDFDGIDLGAAAAPPSDTADVLHALLALGYNEREALSAMKGLAEDVGVSDGIRQALKLLSKG